MKRYQLHIDGKPALTTGLMDRPLDMLDACATDEAQVFAHLLSGGWVALILEPGAESPVLVGLRPVPATVGEVDAQC